MKALLFFLLSCTSSLASVAASQPTASGKILFFPEERVEAFFQQHFASLEQALRTNTALSQADKLFVYVVMYLADDTTAVDSYTGTPLVQAGDLQRYRARYGKHRPQITWNSITALLALLQEPLFSEEQLTRLESYRLRE